jgi:beta-barrel assembly-enhancing protease
MRPRIAVMVAIGLLADGFVWGRKPGDPLKPGYNLYSRQQDIQLGQIMAAQVKLRFPEVRDEFLETYIRRVGERLANTPEARQSAFPFQFTLLRVPVVNAFALPGGPMFVFTGLLSSTENEAQLAGVMAHEMSHVILRHGTHEASKAKATGFVAALGAALGAAAAGNQAGAAQLSRMGAGLGQNSLLLHFSREAESEADLLGTHLMAESGYDPKEMAAFFEKLGRMGNTGVQFFSDHPNPDNRERAIEEEITGLPVRTYGYETGDFAHARLAVNTLVPVGRGRGSVGAQSAGIAPPIEWKQAQARSYGVTYPGNWQSYGGTASDLLIVAPLGGLMKTPKGGLDLGLGMMLSYYQPESKDMSPGTATLSLVAHLHELDPTMQLTSTEQRSVRVDNADGLISTLRATSARLGVETVVLLTILRPEGVFYALAIAPAGQFPLFRAEFDQVLNSIRFGTASILQASPQ